MDYQAILTEAHAAAFKAQEGLVENMHAMNCGFAWVKVSGNSGLARYCRKALKDVAQDAPYKQRAFYGDKDYPTGWSFWKPGDFNGQSVDIHRTGALAFLAVLQSHGIAAKYGTRLD